MIKDSERDHVVRVTAGTWGRFEGDESKTYRVGDTVKCTAEELESHRFQVELVSGPEAKPVEPEEGPPSEDTDGPEAGEADEQGQEPETDEPEVEDDEPEEPDDEPEVGLQTQLQEAGLPDIGTVHHQTAVKAINEADHAHLELLRASENARDGGPRESVLEALDAAESGE